MHGDSPPKLTPGAAKETVARTNAKRRLYTYQPINTVLRRIDALQRRLLEEGMDAFDPGFEAKRGALMGQLVFEAAMAADEGDIPLLRKADLVPRMVPFFNYLKELAPKDGAKFPHTEKMLDSEMAARNATMAKLVGKQNPDIEAILDVLAPAAAEPPKEA